MFEIARHRREVQRLRALVRPRDRAEYGARAWADSV